MPSRKFTAEDSVKGLAVQRDIKQSQVEAFLEFQSLGWSRRRIAARLGVSERTLQRYARDVRDDPGRFLRGELHP